MWARHFFMAFTHVHCYCWETVPSGGGDANLIMCPYSYKEFTFRWQLKIFSYPQWIQTPFRYFLSSLVIASANQPNLEMALATTSICLNPRVYRKLRGVNQARSIRERFHSLHVFLDGQLLQSVHICSHRVRGFCSVVDTWFPSFVTPSLRVRTANPARLPREGLLNFPQWSFNTWIISVLRWYQTACFPLSKYHTALWIFK